MGRLLLAGATGLVGSEVLKRLLSDDRVERIVAPTRRPLPPHAKLLNPVAAIDDLPDEAELWTVDGAICALGTTRAKSPSLEAYRAIDHDFPLAIAKRVRARGAASFALVSSMGANARSWFRYTRIKGELEEAVDRLGFRSLTIVRPGFLDGDRVEKRAAERAIGSLLRITAPILPMAARVSPASTVAALLIEAALGGHEGKHVIDSADIARAAANRVAPSR